MTKQAQQIEVGIHDGRPGFTITYTDGERAHFVFARGIAKQLAEKLSTLVRDLEYMEQQMRGIPQERIGVQEHVRVQLTPPPDSGTLGLSAGDGVNVE